MYCILVCRGETGLSSRSAKAPGESNVSGYGNFIRHQTSSHIPFQVSPSEFINASSLNTELANKMSSGLRESHRLATSNQVVMRVHAT